MDCCKNKETCRRVSSMPNGKEFLNDQSKINEMFRSLSKKERLLPINVSPFYQKKIDEEVAFLHRHDGPLHRVGYPSIEKITVRVKGEVADYVDDRMNMIDSLSETAIQKYEDRLLLLTTSTCAGHCQYCFRQDVLTCKLKEAKPEISSQLHELEAFLKKSPKIREVILSGGDPMTLPIDVLRSILNVLEKFSLSSIRIHTRSLIYAPSLISEQKLELLAKARVRLVFHIVHPYEICSEVEAKIKQIQSYGIRCYNQFPLLRNINDHHKLLIKHLYRLDELGIRNLSIFIPDPINYSGAFRMNLGRLFRLIDSFNWGSPSWINSTRFVLDTIVGKVRREDVKEYVSGEYAIFCREGKEVLYPDFPAELDVPGDLKTLLWKDSVDSNLY